MTEYDPELTFSKNARNIIDRVVTNRSVFLESEVQKFIYQAYEDGWLDAHAQVLAGGHVGECPRKEMD